MWRRPKVSFWQVGSSFNTMEIMYKVKASVVLGLCIDSRGLTNEETAPTFQLGWILKGMVPALCRRRAAARVIWMTRGQPPAFRNVGVARGTPHDHCGHVGQRSPRLVPEHDGSGRSNKYVVGNTSTRYPHSLAASSTFACGRRQEETTLFQNKVQRKYLA
jgi:hypothetical protein